MTTVLKWIAFACGLAIVGWVAAETDLAAVAADVTRLGGAGAAAVLIALLLGFACVGGFTVVLFAMLHLRTLAAIERRLAAGRWGEKLHRALELARDVEQRLFTFVRHRPLRFAAAIILSFVTWLSGAAEVFIVLR